LSVNRELLKGDRFVILAHGTGGRLMHGLIEQKIARHLGNPDLDVQADAATLSLPPGEVMMTTDGFAVQPPGVPVGDIGSLAMHGRSTTVRCRARRRSISP
jgi:hydrogenase expression/formation protein HypE